MRREVSIDDVRYLLVGWKEIDRMIDELEDRIREKPYKPSLIVGVLRGGAVVASLLSDRLGMHNIRSVGARIYERTGKRGEKVDIYQQLLTGDLGGFDVLAVEDVVDTGTTYTSILQQQIYPKKPRSLCTVSLHIKPWTKYRPDIYIEETDSWIWYPWETYETGRDIYIDLLRKHDPQTSRNILVEKFKIKPSTVERIAKSARSNA